MAAANHFFRSGTRYSVHSPFVYDLITKALKPQIPAEHTRIIKNIEREISQLPPFMSTDLGTGSNRELNGKALLKMSINDRYGSMLYGISRHFSPENILELGTSAGLSAAWAALGNQHTKLTTVEGCPEKAAIAKDLFNRHGLKNVQIINQDAAEYINLLKSKNQKVQLIFIDAGHSYESTKAYYNSLLPLCTENSVMIFDDIYWSLGMTEAWNEITADEKLSLSVATMRLGMVFFRKGIEKQNFRLRL